MYYYVTAFYCCFYSSIIDLHQSFYITLNPGVMVSGLVEDTVSKLATVFQALGRGLAAGQ